MANGKNGVPRKHPWPSEAHDTAHVFSPLPLEAVHGALRTRRLVASVRAPRQTIQCILAQIRALIAKLAVGTVTVAAVYSNHRLDRFLLTSDPGFLRRLHVLPFTQVRSPAAFVVSGVSATVPQNVSIPLQFGRPAPYPPAFRSSTATWISCPGRSAVPQARVVASAIMRDTYFRWSDLSGWKAARGKPSCRGLDS